jgi:hypothetical protein
MLIQRIKSKFIKEEQMLTKQDCVTIIRGRGFNQDSEFSFSKGSFSYRTQIDVFDTKVWIKAYCDGYGESETIHFPITKKQFLAFIRSNAV